MENNFIGDFMEKTIWSFSGVWNGDCYHDWFSSEVKE